MKTLRRFSALLADSSWQSSISSPRLPEIARHSRLFDTAFAAVLLAVLSPLMMLAAILILLDDGRPVFFRQRRIGREGTAFWILKFRTMSAGCTGLAITARNDPRVTRAGAWLRRYKVDELPQFLNVLRGEMSLIGPRPEVPQYVDLSAGLWRSVLRFRPGVTDLASLVFRSEEDCFDPSADPDFYYRTAILPVKLRLNLEYQKSRSFIRDLKLLCLTGWYSLCPAALDRQRVALMFGVAIAHPE